MRINWRQAIWGFSAWHAGSLLIIMHNENENWYICWSSDSQVHLCSDQTKTERYQREWSQRNDSRSISSGKQINKVVDFSQCKGYNHCFSVGFPPKKNHPFKQLYTNFHLSPYQIITPFVLNTVIVIRFLWPAPQSVECLCVSTKRIYILLSLCNIAKHSKESIMFLLFDKLSAGNINSYQAYLFKYIWVLFRLLAKRPDLIVDRYCM